MCGIFGIVFETDRPLGEVLTGAASRLAYRGYDSVGAAAVSAAGAIDLRKDVGRVDDVADRLRFAELTGSRGITQLRWATPRSPLSCLNRSLSATSWTRPTSLRRSIVPSAMTAAAPTES